MTDDVPFCVEPGWQRTEFIDNVDEWSYQLVFWSDTRVGFKHRCDRGERGIIVCAPLLKDVDMPGGHHITWSMNAIGEMRPTVTPSIMCPDCGTHGFVRNGRWVDA